MVDILVPQMKKKIWLHSLLVFIGFSGSPGSEPSETGIKYKKKESKNVFRRYETH